MCVDERPKNVYSAMGLVRGHLAVQGRLDTNGDV